jgi:hypothetical protein
VKRLLALLIAVLLPLQLAWGMAASYCQHEQAASGAGHFGHHSHVHVDAQHGAKNPGGSALQTDLDCTGCHAATSAVPTALPTLPAHLKRTGVTQVEVDLRRPSAPQRAPDRPQWPRLA